MLLSWWPAISCWSVRSDVVFVVEFFVAGSNQPQAWAVGPIQAELAMMVLARLIEDCHDVDFRSEVGGIDRLLAGYKQCST